METKEIINNIINIIKKAEETAIETTADHNGEPEEREYLLAPEDVKYNIINDIEYYLKTKKII